MNQPSCDQIISRIQAAQRRGTTVRELADNFRVCQSTIARILSSVRHNLEHHTNKREGERVFTWRNDSLFPDRFEADELIAAGEGPQLIVTVLDGPRAAEML